MAMHVRNFYVDGCVDGRQSNVSGGPKNKEGGMRLEVTQRNDGEVETAFVIKSYVAYDGELITRVTNSKGEIIGEHRTKR